MNAKWNETHGEVKVVELTNGEHTVLLVPLGHSSRTTRGINRESVLVVHMNPHPRPSFAMTETLGGLPLERAIHERFRLDDYTTATLACAIERALDERHRTQRYVLFNEEAGIYLGNAIGLGFWSKLDPVGQTHACTFESERAAVEHVASWAPPPKFGIEVRCVKVADVKAGASAAECVAAGLPGWTP